MEKNTAFRRHIMTQEGEMDGRMDAGRREMRKGEKAEGGNEEEKGKGKKKKRKKEVIFSLARRTGGNFL